MHTLPWYLSYSLTYPSHVTPSRAYHAHFLDPVMRGEESRFLPAYPVTSHYAYL